MINSRAFVSFDEPCRYQCKHCYTYSIARQKYRTIDEIVDSIGKESFDIVYVSQKTDNFSAPQRGLELCEKLVERYACNIFIITRSVFDKASIKRLVALNNHLLQIKRRLFIAVSINALDSYNISEDARFVPTPFQRIEFLRRLSQEGLSPILMVRPVLPDSLIPIEECLDVIKQCASSVSCVVSSGLGVNEDVLRRLGIQEDTIQYCENQEYLQGAIDCDIKFVDVHDELAQIENKCIEFNCPFFSHSMPALNYLSTL